MPLKQDRDLEALRSSLDGHVLGPNDNGWDVARQAFNLTLDQRPELVALPANPADVVRLVEFASREGVRIAAQRTGHNAAPLGDLRGTILLKTSTMNGADVDAEARRARVGAGAQWQDVVPGASELGLAALHGSAPDIGIVGYSLGGGVGWYARKLGLAANSVTAIELVTADGGHVRASADEEPELFWALRGGGGNFGVVTAMEFALHEVPEIYAGVLFFPFDRAAEVLQAWREWTETVPDEVTSVGRIMQFPPLELVPEPLRGRSFSLVEATFMGSEAAGRELLGPLRDLGPEMDTFEVVPPAALPALHMDPPEPVPYGGEDGMLGELPPKAIDDLLEVAGPGSGSPLLSVELRHLGGALARAEPGNGALGAVDGSFLSYSVGMFGDEAGRSAVESSLARVREAIAPYGGVRRYSNFVEAKIEPTDLFDAESLERLRQVKAQVDPENLFQANHALGVA
jgi:FAD/FMN-containing dehydrogenase